MSTLEQIIKIIRQEAKKLPDSRGSKHLTYSMEDILLSAFGVFYFQSGSWLNFQRNMQNQAGRNNAKSLFNVDNIPSDNHIRDVLDDIGIDKLQPMFDRIYKLLLKKKTLDKYQYFDNTLMILLDGTYYHSSQKIHCDLCQTRQKEDAKGNKYTEYYHSAITPIVAHPKSNNILPLLPEMISNTDGEKKQDCEINASKRWLEKEHLLSQHYKLLILGDDLYCKTSLIQAIRTKEYNFIFVCKESSHKKMYEIIDYVQKLGEVDTKVVTKLNKSRKKEIYSYSYLNDVDLTGDKDCIRVNWCSVEVTNEEGKRLYRGSFATDYKIDENNVEEIVEAGRTRWKIENENNNTLKNGGYALEHNFGHGKKGLTQLLFTLNILSFLTHTISLKYDDGYRQLYELINNRKTFFNHINTFTTFFYILNWDTLWHLMIKGYIDGLHLSDIKKLE
jgi:hypothetical protein